MNLWLEANQRIERSADQTFERGTVEHQFVDVFRLLALTEMYGTAAGDQPDDAPLNGGITPVELEVAWRDAGGLFIPRGSIFRLQQMRHPGHPVVFGHLLEDAVAVANPAKVDLTW